MTFLSDRKTQPRTHLSLLATSRDREQTCAAVMANKTTIGPFLMAALLAFEALDREAQVTKVVTAREAFSNKRTANDYWHVNVEPVMRDRVKGWPFPMFSQIEVVTAAVRDFVAMPMEYRADWLHELYVFVGDPRQENA